MSASTFVITLNFIIKTINNLVDFGRKRLGRLGKKLSDRHVFTIFCSPCSSVPIKPPTELKKDY